MNYRATNIFLLLIVLSLPMVAANPITDFFSGISSSVTNTFDSMAKFLLKLEIVGLNIVEVLLFIVFIVLLVALFIIPAKVYAYAKDSAAPVKAFFAWIRK